MILARCLMAAVGIGSFIVFSCPAVEPEFAELSFSAQSQQKPFDTNTPRWLLALEQDGGTFIDEPPCWHVETSAPAGRGRLVLSIDRQIMQEDLALTVLYEQNDDADLAVQLFDADNRVVALDLFSNLVA